MIQKLITLLTIWVALIAFQICVNNELVEANKKIENLEKDINKLELQVRDCITESRTAYDVLVNGRWE